MLPGSAQPSCGAAVLALRKTGFEEPPANTLLDGE